VVTVEASGIYLAITPNRCMKQLGLTLLRAYVHAQDPDIIMLGEIEIGNSQKPPDGTDRTFGVLCTLIRAIGVIPRFERY